MEGKEFEKILIKVLGYIYSSIRSGPKLSLLLLFRSCSKRTISSEKVVTLLEKYHLAIMATFHQV